MHGIDRAVCFIDGAAFAGDRSCRVNNFRGEVNLIGETHVVRISRWVKFQLDDNTRVYVLVRSLTQVLKNSSNS